MRDDGSLAAVRLQFLDEAGEMVDELDAAILQLESEPDDEELLNRVFRAAHTIKGTGSTLGFDVLARFAHGMENLLILLRARELAMDPVITDILLRCTDHLRVLLDATRCGGPGEEDEARSHVLADELRQVTIERASSPGERVHEDAGAESPPPPQEPAAGGVGNPVTEYAICFDPHPGFFAIGAEPALVLEELAALGTLEVTARLHRLPLLEALAPEECFLGWTCRLRTVHDLAAVRECFAFYEDVADLSISSPVRPNGKPAATALLASGVEFTPVTFPDGALEEFVQEGQEHLEVVGQALLRLEQVPHDRDSVAALLRAFHSIKGAAGLTLSLALGPADQRCTLAWLRDASHLAESLLERVRAGTAAADGPLVERLLGLSDALQVELGGIHVGKPLVVRGAGAWSLLDALRDAVTGAAATPPQGPAVVSGLPGPVLPGGAEPDRGPAHAVAASTATIRVDPARLDGLLRLAGELVITQSALTTLGAQFQASSHGTQGREYKDALTQLRRISRELHAGVMTLRMLPIKTVFQKYPRMVRDLARSLGKDMQLVVQGETIELDRVMLERIADPLVHLVRNAADHGIETARERSLARKPPTGTISLRAAHEASFVLLEVEDDGRGLDPLQLKSHAVAVGLVSQARADAMTDREAFQLILAPGFSTAARVTEVSGRGVGMDVVRSNIEQLHGTLDIDSRAGAGCTFSIRLPASVMVSRGILVECAGQEFILPLDQLRDLVKLEPSQVLHFDAQRMACIRGDLHPLISLADFIGTPGRGDGEGQSAVASRPSAGERPSADGRPSADSDGMVSVALLEAAGGRLALQVGRFVNEVEIIVKPLEGALARLPMYAGAAIMGDGRVVLVLHPSGLISCRALPPRAGPPRS